MPRGRGGRGGKKGFKARARRYKGRRRGQRITNINHSLQPIPARYICRMKYAETLTTNVGGQYVINLNSIYDPERTGGGHQPYGFDYLANLFNRYRVISTSWRINMPAGTGANPITWAAMPSNDNGITWTAFSEVAENPRAKYITQNPGAGCVYLNGRSYLPALMGRTRTQYMADDKYEATVAANPTENALLYIQSFNSSGVPVGAVTFNIVLEFVVEWFDVKRLLQSVL